jgi:cytochrome P450
MSVNTAAPVSDIDLFTDEHDRDPYPDYAALRAAGGAVWMQRHELWAISRYADVRAALADWQTFSSAQSVGLNSVINELTEGGVITADPPAHERLREILSSRLAAREIQSLRAQIEQQAADLVDEVAEVAEIDGVEDIAKRFPLSVVFDLICAARGVMGDAAVCLSQPR